MSASRLCILKRIHDNRALKRGFKGVDFLRKSILYGFGVGYIYRGFAVVTLLILSAAIGPVHTVQVAAQPGSTGQSPRLINTCVITSDVKRLVDFYEPVLKLKAKWSGPDYAEFPTGVGVFAIFSAKAQDKYMPGSSEASMNRSVILEFRVANVDLEYQRLQGLVKIWAKPPSTQPWGTRSVYFRDPDGNLVDFFTPAVAS